MYLHFLMVCILNLLCLNTSIIGMENTFQHIIPFIPGSIAGALEPCLNQPLIVVKNTLQTGGDIKQFFSSPQKLWKGLPISSTAMGMNTGLQVGINTTLDHHVENPFARSFLAGAASAYLCASPVELIVVQQQKLNMSALQTITTLTKRHGLSVLWKGCPWTACREGVFTIGYISGSDYCSERIQQNIENCNPAVAKMTGTLLAATGAITISHPFDTIKTVLAHDLENQKYSSTKNLLLDMNMQKLFQGYSARLARGFLAIMWLSYATKALEFQLHIK